MASKGPDPALDEYAEEAQRPEPAMQPEAAASLWAELDNWRQGYVSGHMLQRWLEVEGSFQIGSSEARYLYAAFGAREREQRITED